jgi:hypothetical protein
MTTAMTTATTTTMTSHDHCGPQAWPQPYQFRLMPDRFCPAPYQFRLVPCQINQYSGWGFAGIIGFEITSKKSVYTCLHAHYVPTCTIVPQIYKCMCTARAGGTIYRPGPDSGPSATRPHTQRKSPRYCGSHPEEIISFFLFINLYDHNARRLHDDGLVHLMRCLLRFFL